MTRYVGIDLHKHLIVGHVVDAVGTKVDTFRYESVDAATLEHIGRQRLNDSLEAGRRKYNEATESQELGR